MYLPPGHPIIAIRNNRNQNGRRMGKRSIHHRSHGFTGTSIQRKLMARQPPFPACLFQCGPLNTNIAKANEGSLEH